MRILFAHSGLKTLYLQRFQRKWLRSLMDRASDYGSEGCRFESCRGHKHKKILQNQ